MQANPRLISVSAACLLLNLAGAQQKGITYGFTTEHYAIEMAVGFPEPYVGQRLIFYSSLNPQKELCYSGDGGTLGKCLERFVGAVAIVQYSVTNRNGKPNDPTTIREHVTVMAQSDNLPHRPPFSKTIDLANGIGSDVQVFGYDESDVKKSDRIRTRRHATQTSWRVYRQELYIDREFNPFAIVEWKYTVDRISVVRVRSPGGTQ
jgi:hypothetical protein